MTKNKPELLDQRKQEVNRRTDRTLAPFGAPQLSSSPVTRRIEESTAVVVLQKQCG